MKSAVLTALFLLFIPKFLIYFPVHEVFFNKKSTFWILKQKFLRYDNTKSRNHLTYHEKLHIISNFNVF